MPRVPSSPLGFGAYQAVALISAYPTGLADLDRATGGGEPGDLWVIGGPRGVGKSLLALSLARAVAIRADVPVTWVSTRNQPQELADAVLAAEAGFLAHRSRAGTLTDEQQERHAQVLITVQQAPITFEAASRIRLLATAAERAGQQGTKVVVLDALPEAGFDALAHLKTLATRNGTWVVAVVADLGPDRFAAQQALSDTHDRLLWVERDDLHDPGHPRVGEADIYVQRPGTRAASPVTVAYQERHRRFVGLRT